MIFLIKIPVIHKHALMIRDAHVQVCSFAERRILGDKLSRTQCMFLSGLEIGLKVGRVITAVIKLALYSGSYSSAFSRSTNWSAPQAKNPPY